MTVVDTGILQSLREYLLDLGPDVGHPCLRTGIGPSIFPGNSHDLGHGFGIMQLETVLPVKLLVCVCM